MGMRRGYIGDAERVAHFSSWSLCKVVWVMISSRVVGGANSLEAMVAHPKKEWDGKNWYCYLPFSLLPQDWTTGLAPLCQLPTAVSALPDLNQYAFHTSHLFLNQGGVWLTGWNHLYIYFVQFWCHLIQGRSSTQGGLITISITI